MQSNQTLKFFSVFFLYKKEKNRAVDNKFIIRIKNKMKFMFYNFCNAMLNVSGNNSE